MSHTSTDSPRSSFTRALAFTIAALVVLCGVFLALGYFQGPKLEGAQVDTSSVIQRPGQQLRLFANQPVASITADQVTVTPAAEFTVETSGDIIAVQFASALRYATRYEVRVDGVTGIYTPQGSTLAHSFFTASPPVYVLDHRDTGDEIVHAGLRNEERSVVYSAPGITDFVALGKTLVVATADAAGSSSLDLVSLDSPGIAQRLALPHPGTVADLSVAASGTTIGFTLDDGSSDFGVPLYSMDLLSGAPATAVTGLDGSPLRVLGWQFVPLSTALVALTSDSTLVLIDGASVLPLGQYRELLSVSGDGTTALVTNAVGTLSVDLATGTSTDVPLRELGSRPTFLGTAVQAGDGIVIAKAVLGDDAGADYLSVILRFTDGTPTVLFETPPGGGAIESFSVSPNGQYVAVVVSDPTTDASTTSVVDAATGLVAASFEGAELHW